MPDITAIITAYRRPANIVPLVQSLRAQSVPAAAIWAWANDPSQKIRAILDQAKLDRGVISSDNAYFHGRFALALLAPTEFVAILDDDTMPGENWFANCLETMQRSPGILGTAGVVLHEAGYANRTMHGWQRPCDDATEVDLVGQAWFLRTDWVKHLFSGPAIFPTNGEDIELAARAWRLAGIRSFCPPHPAGDQSRWGSTRGLELGVDEVAASRRVEHLAERKRIVEAEIAAGWRPLFMREEGTGHRAQGTEGSAENALCGIPPVLPLPPGEGRGEGGLRQAQPSISIAAEATTPESDSATSSYIHTEISCEPRWVTQYSYPLDNDAEHRRAAQVILRLDAPGDEACCLDCVSMVESLGQGDLGEGDAEPEYDRIDSGPALELVRDPLAFLRRARRLLQPGGELTASVANTRRESVIRGLIEGRWKAVNERGPLRFFTRRELEKLLYRAGFHATAICPSVNDLARSWQCGTPQRAFPTDSSLPANVQGRLARAVSTSSPPPFINGLPESEAEEFNVERYSVTATAEPKRDYGLTSIVIVTHNEVGCTRACLASIRFVTDEAYELIVVDNGSTDGTVEYLRSCPDVKLIENRDNRGFPAAANQGIAASQGRQVLLLNNDVLVTTGWLRRMLQALREEGPHLTSPGGRGMLREEDPHLTSPGGRGMQRAGGEWVRAVGLVGPCSNFVSGPQQVAAGYDDLSALDGFAWEWAKQNAGRREDVDRLVGFCLLISREAIERVGLLDERFGIGNFEDDDYCRRAAAAGFRLVIARDAFVHHFGHRSFAAAGVDLANLLERNRKIYEEKWGTEGPELETCSRDLRSRNWQAQETLSAPVGQETFGRATGRVGRPCQNQATEAPAAPNSPCSLSPVPCSLSLCMIVRQNARTIRACLESVKPWVDEIIVVDTGSTDATRDICRELGAEVHHFAWPKSFAVARNESLKYAQGEWIFWMDSDDVIDADNGRKLRSLACGTHAPNTLGYVMQVYCPGGGVDGAHDVTVVDHLKLFRNHRGLCFEGRIHEQVLDAINRSNGDVIFTDIFVVHAGADHSPEGRRTKLKRDIKLLRLDLRDRPNHTFVHFNLGMTYADAGKHRKAVKALKRSLELAQPHESHVRKVYAILASSLRELGQRVKARQACLEGLKLYPKDPELLFRHAMLLHEDGRLRAAELSYLAALANNDGLHFSSIDSGIVGFKARHNLAAVYQDMGALAKAKAQWRRIIEEVPGYRDGWRGLVENLISQGRWSDAEQVAHQLLARQPQLRGLAQALAARAVEASGRADAALEICRRATKECPDELAPLDELCRLLFDRSDFVEAEQALRELVHRQPANAAAHHNLGTVLLRSGRFQEAAGELRTSLCERPASAVTQLSLGYALSNTGERAEASAAFEQCIRLAPEDPLAAEARRQLAALSV
ncbi:MAG TPA: glycosyltransferase [Pirellulales bacterium]|nr:glycosyltransferase [Pirellulales bacterium]